MYHYPKPEFENGIKVPYDLDESALIPLLKDRKQKWVAFTALGYKDSDTSLQLLIKYSASTDVYERIAAINALANHAKGSSAIDVFSHALSDEKSLIIRTACEAVEKLRLRVFHDTVAQLIDSSDSQIRVTAIRAIDILWNTNDLAKMVAIFKNKNDPCHTLVGFILRNHANTSNWFELFKLFAEIPHPPRYRTYACDIAREFGDEKAINLLLKFTKDTNGHIRKHATMALERINGAG